MKHLFTYIFILFTFSLFGQSCKSDSQVLKQTICELIGDEYRFESFKQFYSRIDRSDLDYDYYLDNRKELEPSKQVIFINPIFNENGNLKIDFLVNNLTDSIEKNDYSELFKSFLNQLNDKPNINIEEFNSLNCGYKFYSIYDDLLYDFRPSERTIFSVSPVIKAKDESLACFYIAGGRASYIDYFVIVKKVDDSWEIIKKWNIGEY